MMQEFTLEITNYCPHGCKYCSSNAKDNIKDAIFMTTGVAIETICGRIFDVIHISGGEPLSNPEFYQILQIAKNHAKDVIVHTNALTHIAFNANVVDNVYVDGYLTVADNVNKINIVKRVKQGREMTRPEVHFSSNFTSYCQCNANNVVLPDGTVVKSPCQKTERVEEMSLRDVNGDLKINGKYCPNCFTSTNIVLIHSSENQSDDKKAFKCWNCDDMNFCRNLLTELPSNVEILKQRQKRIAALRKEIDESVYNTEDLENEIREIQNQKI